MPRSRTLTAAAGLLTLVLFAALALNWQPLATHYHLWQLRRDPGHLGQALVAPDGGSAHVAAEFFLRTEEGKKAFIRLYESVITEALEDGALDFRPSATQWAKVHGALPEGFESTYRTVFGILKESVDSSGFAGGEVFVRSKLLETKTPLLIALQDRAQEFDGFACRIGDSRWRFLRVHELGPEFAPLALGGEEEVVLFLEEPEG